MRIKRKDLIMPDFKNGFRNKMLRDIILPQDKNGGFLYETFIAPELSDVISNDSEEEIKFELKINDIEVDIDIWFDFFKDRYKKRYEEYDDIFMTLVDRVAEDKIREMNISKFNEIDEISTALSEMNVQVKQMKHSLTKNVDEALSYKFPKVIDKYFDSDIALYSCIDSEENKEWSEEEFCKLVDSFHTHCDLLNKLSYLSEDKDVLKNIIYHSSEIVEGYSEMLKYNEEN